MGTMNDASYSASKWGIIGLIKSAALELGQYNVAPERYSAGFDRHASYL
jgi:NAD(P)-dependent dehydrogenase (short-subunit alcohol dehydrogenase family)